jgi:hypothetical protein
LKIYLNISLRLRLGLPSCLSQVTHQNPVYVSPLPIRGTCPAQQIYLDLFTRILGVEYRSLSSSLCSFLHSPVTSSPYSRMHLAFLTCERPRFEPIRVQEAKLHSCISVFKFLDRKLKGKRFWTKWCDETKR